MMTAPHRAGARSVVGILAAGVLSAACATSLAGPPAATPTLGEGSPLDLINGLIEAINAGDVATAYAALGPSVQEQISEEQLAAALESVEEGTGGALLITLAEVHESEEQANFAEIELTLRIQAGEAVDFTLREVAIFERIDGLWRLSDHFLQTALVSLGVLELERLERAFDAEGCLTGDVLEGVYAPSRLQVLDPCVSTSGTVHDLTNETDGDITFNLDVPAEDEFRLNDENRSRKNGMLHIEIIPGDQGRVPAPANGDHVRVTGAWVLDAGHGWNEIHPAWTVEQVAPAAPPGLPATGHGPESY